MLLAALMVAELTRWLANLTSVSQTKELNERFVKGAEQLANAAAKSARGQSKAA
jgi:hypothetical protein